jgi:hypothetical protein
LDRLSDKDKLSGELASEVIDGANVWELQASDRAPVAAFMRGLNRTAVLKFDHPGLDTAATRDGERLLLQNDIGTNDAHVLVLQACDEMRRRATLPRSSRRWVCSRNAARAHGMQRWWRVSWARSVSSALSS